MIFHYYSNLYGVFFSRMVYSRLWAVDNPRLTTNILLLSYRHYSFYMGNRSIVSSIGVAQMRDLRPTLRIGVKILSTRRAKHDQISARLVRNGDERRRIVVFHHVAFSLRSRVYGG